MTPAILARLGLRASAACLMYYALDKIFWAVIMVWAEFTGHGGGNPEATFLIFTLLVALFGTGTTVWFRAGKLVPFFIPTAAQNDDSLSDERWNRLLWLVLGCGLATKALAHLISASSVHYLLGQPKPIQGLIEAIFAVVLVISPSASGGIVKRLFTTNWWHELLALRARVHGAD